MVLGNHSTIMEFILLGVSANPHIQVMLFVLFLGIYLLTRMGNLTLMMVIRTDSHLCSPMYFFLSHFSFPDLCLTSITVPKMLENLLSQKKSISVEGCLAQAFFVFSIAGTEAFVLSAMAYDRYTDICYPLLYGQVMSKHFCVGLVWVSCGLGFLDALINTLVAWNLDFWEAHVLPHFSCELPSLFSLSYSDISTNFAVLVCSAIVHASGNLLLVFFSYAHIVSTTLTISSTTGRSKAFSTCSSHLSAVSFFYGSAFLRYLVPTLSSPLELVFSMQYSVVTPLVNPLVYSLKSKEVKAALRRMLQKGLQHLR
ncbi:LOW QUALITY PROTEIN: olfactory receptor 8S1-like [Diceros bicornis minor]|uniref:LOW QUALITY PROTEIN: olfactory receptor 8S1-like n=1 Tax=Diceros bicornis minor TaxID=77932 RepID=UPI0026F22B4B|nr:LOW QUALITY PROTEIN: olfactory receptor 8S1-like [Diceros bicornis minor]